MDPASVRDRHEMYRLLIERTNPKRVLGDRGELSPFWGYDAQLSWQHASGRLGAGDRIDPSSWWGACNYALSVVPYAVAMAHDLVPRVELDLAGYARAMPHWHGAFHRMLALQGESGPVDLEPLRFAIWRAHLASITIATERHTRELARMSRPEQAFARGWIRMVDLFGAAALRTDLVYLEARPASLPSRMLRAQDDLADLSRHERSTVRRVSLLGERPAWRWPLELALWKRMMRTRTSRDQLETVMVDLFAKDLRGRMRAARRLL